MDGGNVVGSEEFGAGVARGPVSPYGAPSYDTGSLRSSSYLLSSPSVSRFLSFSLPHPLHDEYTCSLLYDYLIREITSGYN
jgi:hypothetical protein